MMLDYVLAITIGLVIGFLIFQILIPWLAGVVVRMHNHPKRRVKRELKQLRKGRAEQDHAFCVYRHQDDLNAWWICVKKQDRVQELTVRALCHGFVMVGHKDNLTCKDAEKLAYEKIKLLQSMPEA